MRTGDRAPGGPAGDQREPLPRQILGVDDLLETLPVEQLRRQLSRADILAAYFNCPVDDAKAVAAQRFQVVLVTGFSYTLVFIAGATSFLQRQASTVVESMLSAMPWAILAMMLAEAGATITRSARLASATLTSCTGSCGRRCRPCSGCCIASQRSVG